MALAPGPFPSTHMTAKHHLSSCRMKKVRLNEYFSLWALNCYCRLYEASVSGGMPAQG